MDQGAWQATVHGVTRVRHDLGLNHHSTAPQNQCFGISKWASFTVFLGVICGLWPETLAETFKSCFSDETVLWILCLRALLAFKTRCFGSLSFKSRSYKLGCRCEVQMFCFSGRNFQVLSSLQLWITVMGVKSESVSRSVCLTLCNPVDCSPPGPFIHGVLQARIPEWVAIPLFRGYSQPRDWTQVCCIAGRFFTIWATREALVGAGWGSWCDCILVSSTYFDFFFSFLFALLSHPFSFSRENCFISSFRLKSLWRELNSGSSYAIILNQNFKTQVLITIYKELLRLNSKEI